VFISVCSSSLQKPFPHGRAQQKDIKFELGLRALKFYVNAFALVVFVYLVYPKTAINIGYFYFGVWDWTGFVFAAILTWFNFCICITYGVYGALFLSYTGDSIQRLGLMK